MKGRKEGRKKRKEKLAHSNVQVPAGIFPLWRLHEVSLTLPFSQHTVYFSLPSSTLPYHRPRQILYTLTNRSNTYTEGPLTPSVCVWFIWDLDGGYPPPQKKREKIKKIHFGTQRGARIFEKATTISYKLQYICQGTRCRPILASCLLLQSLCV